MANHFDKFDTETNSSFVGSYVDDILVGDREVNQVVPTGEAAPRILLGSKLDGIAASTLNSMFVPYGYYLGFVSGSAKGRPTRATNLFDDTEFLEDSFVPHPIEINRRNVEKQTLFSWEFPSTPYFGARWGVDPIPSPELIQGAGSILMLVSTHTVIPNVDSDWRLEFPFETKYKQVGRTLLQSAQFPEIVQLDTDSNSDPVNPVSSSNKLSAVNIYFDAPTGQPVGASNALLVSWMTSNTSSIGFKQNEIGTVTWNDLAFTFFGCGDGGKIAARRGHVTGSGDTATVDIGRYQPMFRYVHRPNIFISYVTAPTIRGFKYGVKNVNAEQLAARWNRNHFGHLRDMFEQRSGYATTNKETGRRLYVPVEVSFVSGSQAAERAAIYLAATSSVVFNPRDSGIYDRFCRSGQPFFE